MSLFYTTILFPISDELRRIEVSVYVRTFMPEFVGVAVSTVIDRICEMARSPVT